MPNSDLSDLEHKRADAAGRPLADTPCLFCGYDLRGLDPAAVCPECGEPVGRTLDGDRLCDAPLAWRRRVAAGLLWIAIGAALTAVPAQLLTQLVWVAQGTAAVRLQYADTIADVVGACLIWIGTMRIASREETRATEVRFSRFRKFLLGLVTLRLLLHAGAHWSGKFGRPVYFASIGVWVLLEVGLIWLLCSWASRLAMRVPNLQLARRIRWCMRGLLAVIGIGLIGTAALILLWKLASNGSVDMQTVVFVSTAIANLCQSMDAVLLIWALGLLLVLRRYLQAEKDSLGSKGSEFPAAITVPAEASSDSSGAAIGTASVQSAGADGAAARALWPLEVAAVLAWITLVMCYAGVTRGAQTDHLHYMGYSDDPSPLVIFLSLVTCVIGCWIVGVRATRRLRALLRSGQSDGSLVEIQELTWFAMGCLWILTPAVVSLGVISNQILTMMRTLPYPAGSVLLVLAWVWALAGVTTTGAAALLLLATRYRGGTGAGGPLLGRAIGVLGVLGVAKLLVEAWGHEEYSGGYLGSGLALLPGMGYGAFDRIIDPAMLLVAAVVIVLLDRLRRRIGHTNSVDGNLSQMAAG